MITFHVYENNQGSDTVVRKEHFSSKPSGTAIKIGRVSSADLRFENDPDMARMHAIVERNLNGIFIIDLGSILGTIVNGKKVNKIRLRSGDIVEMGRQRIRVMLDDHEASA